MIEDVALYLAENTDLIIGKTLFKGNMPDTPVDCVALFDTGGAAPYQEIPVDNPTIQILCRGTSANYIKASERAAEIFSLLNRKFAITIGSKDAMFARAVNSPQCLGLDDKNAWLFSTNFLFRIRTT